MILNNMFKSVIRRFRTKRFYRLNIEQKQNAYLLSFKPRRSLRSQNKKSSYRVSPATHLVFRREKIKIK